MMMKLSQRPQSEKRVKRKQKASIFRVFVSHSLNMRLKVNFVLLPIARAFTAEAHNFTFNPFFALFCCVHEARFTILKIISNIFFSVMFLCPFTSDGVLVVIGFLTVNYFRTLFTGEQKNAAEKFTQLVKHKHELVKRVRSIG
jgi:predicted membrane protein